MKNFVYIAHTSDVRLKVEASDLVSLFEAALEGMNQLIKKNSGGKQKNYTEVISILVDSEDTTTLLIDFLSEVLSLTHLNNCIYSHVNFTELSGDSLSAKLYGVKTDSFDGDVKAVTYHEADVNINEEGNYQTVIVFDV